MKILAFYGSPRRKGNTSLLLKQAVSGAREQGADVDEIVLRDIHMSPCLEIYGCKKTGRCVIDDDFQIIYDKLEVCDGIMLASPIFFFAVSAQVKTLMDRCQAFWVKRHWVQPEKSAHKPFARKALFISVGATGFSNLFDGALLSMNYFLESLETELWDSILVKGVDFEGDILKQPEHLEQAFKKGRQLAAILGR